MSRGIGRISIELARRRAQKWRSAMRCKFRGQWTVIESTAEVVYDFVRVAIGSLQA